jgi:hypothetical protein
MSCRCVTKIEVGAMSVTEAQLTRRVPVCGGLGGSSGFEDDVVAKGLEFA